MTLPPIKGAPPRSRKFHGELPPALYLQLETQSLQRGVTPYKLCSAVLEAFLTGALVQPSKPSPSPSASVAGATGDGSD